MPDSGNSRGHAMLAKCSNPSCTETFRYLGQGRLFRLEADPVSRSYTSYPEWVQEEYFWVCAECSKRYTLHLDEAGHVSVLPLPSPGSGHPAEFAVVSRQDGMMLRSVSSVRMRMKLR